MVDPKAALIGDHVYPGGEDQTSDCANGCGAWAGPYSSGGPAGVDPFGNCPKAPMTPPNEKVSVSDRLAKEAKRLSGYSHITPTTRSRIALLLDAVKEIADRDAQIASAEKERDELLMKAISARIFVDRIETAFSKACNTSQGQYRESLLTDAFNLLAQLRTVLV